MSDETTYYEPPNLGEPEDFSDEMDGGLDDSQIVQILCSYFSEADTARKSGSRGGRDDVWERNIDLYWGNFDWGDKQDWQSREALPDPQQIVDRFAATMKSALNRDEKWFDVENKADIEADLVKAIKKFVQIQLDRCGKNPSGHATPFSNVFERIMKMAAMMAACSDVQYSKDAKTGKGRTVVCEVDPRDVWLDPTGRNLYRIRRTEIDRHELEALKEMKDSSGDPIYNSEAIDRLQSGFAKLDNEYQKEQISGHGKTKESTSRKSVVLDEYLATLVDEQGRVWYRNHLFVVANGNELIRGPEPNPWMHKQDWLIYSPLIAVPFSVYGKSYMENWSSIARVFTELTNLMLDAMFITSIKSYGIVPDALKRPEQAESGFKPGKGWVLEDGADVRNFIKEIDLGTVPPELITSWTLIQKMMREGAMFNEISLGKLAPGEKTATEIAAADQGSSAMMTAIAEWIETGYLEPMLEIIFKCSLQHIDPKDEEIKMVLGEPMFQMLIARKKEFIERRFIFRVRGISNMVEKSIKLRALMSALQIAGQNQMLAQLLQQELDPKKLMAEIFDLIGYDFSRIKKGERALQVDGIIQNQQVQQEALANQAETGPDPNTDPAEVLGQISNAVRPLVPPSNGGGNGQG